MTRISPLILAVLMTALLFPQAVFGAMGVGESPPSVLDTRNLAKGNFEGYVREQGAQGQILGGLAGASVSITGGPSATTNSQGHFSSANLSPGTKTVTASKEGYQPVTRQVVVGAQSSASEIFALQALGGASPQVHDPVSTRGRHLIGGMPGDMTFEALIDWNGTPGTSRFQIAGTWHTAALSDAGSGNSRASLTLPAPGSIASTSEWEIEATNGAGQTALVRTGVFFYPLPPVVGQWFGGVLDWDTRRATQLRRVAQVDVTLWELAAGPVTTSAGYASSLSLSYDSNSGTFAGTAGLSGSFDKEMDVTGVEVLGAGGVGGSGTLRSTLRGFDEPTLSGSLSLAADGKAGVGAPLSIAVDVLFPPAAPIMANLRATPVVRDVVNLIRLRAFLLAGLGLDGTWAPGGAECWLGASSYDISGTLGVEAQGALEVWGAKAGLYAGGTGTPTVQFCPEIQFQDVTIRGYVGAFASYFFFSLKEEVGWQTTLGGQGKAGEILFFPQEDGGSEWHPLGDRLLAHGDMNRPSVTKSARHFSLGALKGSDGAVEEILLENVTTLATPVLLTDESGAWIHFVYHDPEKPWHAATDIGQLERANGSWPLTRVTDNLQAEFNPATADLGQGETLAAWTQAAGDLSDAEGPEDILPELEIMVAELDRQTGSWSSPQQLTSNTVVDRNPQAVVFGERKGVVWVQNEGPDAPGNATNGDRLMFAERVGGTWQTTDVLWEARKGVLEFSAAGDGNGEAHILFIVDEDGDPETVEDRELYLVSTLNGDWQDAVRLTDDDAEDALPLLLTPEDAAMAVWKSGDTLYYSPLASWGPKEVYSEYTPANEAPSLTGLTMPGGAAIAYTVQGESGIDIVVAFYDAVLDQWSLPRQLTNDEHAETSISMAMDGDDLLLTYVKTETLRQDMEVEIEGVVHTIPNVPQPGRSDLALLRHTLGNDLAITPASLAVSPQNPVPGNTATLSARVENRGDLPVTDVELAFYYLEPMKSSELIGSATIPGTLIAGAAKYVEMEWDVPLGTGPAEVFAVVDPDLLVEDRDRSNNVDWTWAILPDLAVATGRSDTLSSTNILIRSTIENIGPIAAGAFDVSFRLEDPDGEEIGRTTIQELKGGATHDASVIWDIAGRDFDGRFATVHAVADPDGAVHEWDESNNSLAISVDIEIGAEEPPPDIPPDARAIGDLNNDGCVSFQDFVFLLEHWGVEFDGVPIGFPDFVAMLEHWGQGC